jgi:hypothetical protein
MKDQHEKITGYRDLSQAEIDTMNKIKALANEVGELVSSLDGPVMGAHGEGAFFPDPRWLAIAKTTLQTGFMQLTRSVAKPESF